MKSKSTLVLLLLAQLMCFLAVAYDVPTDTPPPPPPPPPGGGGGGDGSGGGGPPPCPNSPPCSPACENGTGGDPISLSTGEFSWSRTLLKQQTRIPLAFTLRYSAFFNFHSAVGFAWTFNFNQHLYQTDDGKITIRKPCGVLTTYAAITNQPGQYLSVSTDNEVVSTNGDGTYTMVTKSQMAYYFDSDGKLNKIADGKGAELRLTYDAGGRLPIRGIAKNSNITTNMIVARDFRPTRVDEYLEGVPSGKFLMFSYDANGHIQAVTDQASRTVVLTYDDVNGNLLGITDPMGNPYSYTYYPATRLMQTFSGLGCSACTTWTNYYDGNNRVTDQIQIGNGVIYHVDYDSYRSRMSSLSKDNNGNVTGTLYERVYWITDVYGNKQVSKRIVMRGSAFDEDGGGEDDDYVTQQFYDPNTGMLTMMVNPNGGTNTYQYDVNGNLTNETDQVSTNGIRLVKTYAYDANNNRTNETDYQTDRPSEKFVTIYEYDGQNRKTAEKKVVNPAAGTWTYLTTRFYYDDSGRLTNQVDPRTNAISYAYEDPANPNLPTKVYDPANPAYVTVRSYDAQGNKTYEKDALGRVTLWQYDALNRLTSMTNALLQEAVYTYIGPNLVEEETGKVGAQRGRIKRYEYDELNRRTKVKRVDDADQERMWESYAYDNYGRVLATTNALGQVVTQEYDPMGWLLMTSQPFSATDTSDTQYVYDKGGRKVSEFDPLNIEICYEYDLLDRVTKKTMAYGTTDQRTVEYTYNALNTAVTKTSTQGTNTVTSVFTYDALGRLKTVGGGREYPITYDYDENGNVIGITDACTNKTQFEFDAYNRQVRTIFSDRANYIGGNDTIVNYDLVGNIIQKTDGDGNQEFFNYDALNQQTEQSIPVSAGQSVPINWWQQSQYVLIYIAHDMWRDVTNQQDIANGVQTSIFDRLGRLVTKVDAAGLVLNYSYNDADKLTAIIYPPVPSSGGGQTTNTYNYNQWNMLLLDSVTDRAGNSTSYTYDKRFEKLSETSPLQATTWYQYDNLGRVVAVTNQLNEVVQCAYDQFDEPVQIIHPDNIYGTNERIEWITYDAHGKVLSHSGAGQNPVLYTYDPVGNLKTLTDGNTNTTAWNYDSRNRIIKKTYADGTFYGYGYDGAGNMASRVDGKGMSTIYEYDDFNSPKTIYYPNDAQVTFDYDAGGRRTSMVDGSGTNIWVYDAAGRVITNIQGRVNTVVSYSYDAEGGCLTMDVRRIGASQGWTTTNSYDAAGRLQKIVDSHVSINPFTYAWNEDNWVTNVVMANGAQQQKSYDAVERLHQISGLNSGLVLVNSFAYQYDKAGQRTNETWSDGSKRLYTYDATRQLSTAERFDSLNDPDASYDYTYGFDAVGNFTNAIVLGASQGYLVNNLNQYTNISPPLVTLSYDDDGNTLADGTATYTYDDENRLVRVVRNGNQVDYVYDGLGRIVERQINGSVATRFVYDEMLALQELDGNNTELRTYTWGLDLSQSRQGAGGVGGLLAAHDSTGDYFYLYDGNGNVTDVLKSDNTISAHYVYAPFGQIVSSSGSMANNNPYRFSTKYADDMSGLLYYGTRFYSPTFSRWINRDPSEEQGGINLYTFAANNPVNQIDPEGLSCSGYQQTADIGNKNDPIIIPMGLWMEADLTVGMQLGLSGEKCDKCCPKGANKSEVNGSVVFSGSGEAGFMVGKRLNKDFLGYRFMAMLGVRAFAGIGFEGKGGFTYDGCEDKFSASASATDQLYAGIEGGAKADLLKCKKWGNQYGSGVTCRPVTDLEMMLRGQVTGNWALNIQCDKNNCNVKSEFGGDISLKGILHIFGIQRELTIYQDKFEPLPLSDFNFPSPFKNFE